jgi:hypothetical protein
MLELVRSSEPDNLQAAKAWALLADDAVQHTVEAGQSGELSHTLVFSDHNDSSAVVNTLSAPLTDFVIPFTNVNVRRGAKAFALPVSPQYQRSSRFGQDAITRMNIMRPDIHNLAMVMGDPAATVTATVEVFTEDSVRTEARDRLLAMNFKEIRVFSSELGYELNEVDLMRSLAALKFGRQLRLYHLDNAAMDKEDLSEALRQLVIDTDFYRKSVRTADGFEPVLLPRSQTAGMELRTKPRIELGKVVPWPADQEHKPHVSERREVTFYHKDIASHEARTAIRWIELPNGVIRLDVSGAKAMCDPDAHTTFSSPLLGLAKLANAIDPETFRGPVQTLYRDHPGNQRTRLHPEASGALPGLVSEARVLGRLAWSPLFQKLRQIKRTD